MPHFAKRGRKFGLTSSSLGIEDFKTTTIDTDLTSVSANHDTIASAKTIKDYIDTQGAVSLAGMNDTTISSPADNNHLQYDVSASKWINKTFIEFDKISVPADPDTEEGRMYLKEINATNNALAVKLQKAGNIVEVELTSPGCVCECGSTDGAKDPIFNFMDGVMIIELYCGHSYQMDIPNLRRLK